MGNEPAEQWNTTCFLSNADGDSYTATKRHSSSHIHTDANTNSYSHSHSNPNTDVNIHTSADLYLRTVDPAGRGAQRERDSYSTRANQYTKACYCDATYHRKDTHSVAGAGPGASSVRQDDLLHSG